MDEIGRHAEQQSERGRAAQRDPDADHGRPAHRLHDEQAQDPVDEIEEARDVLSDCVDAEETVGQRSFLGELGDQIGRQADQTAPDHPADPLVVPRAQVLAASDQDRERGDADDEADQYRGPHREFGRIAEHASEARRATSREAEMKIAGSARSIQRHRPSV